MYKPALAAILITAIHAKEARASTFSSLDSDPAWECSAYNLKCTRQTTLSGYEVQQTARFCEQDNRPRGQWEACTYEWLASASNYRPNRVARHWYRLAKATLGSGGSWTVRTFGSGYERTGVSEEREAVLIVQRTATKLIFGPIGLSESFAASRPVPTAVMEANQQREYQAYRCDADAAIVELAPYLEKWEKLRHSRRRAAANAFLEMVTDRPDAVATTTAQTTTNTDWVGSDGTSGSSRSISHTSSSAKIFYPDGIDAERQREANTELHRASEDVDAASNVVSKNTLLRCFTQTQGLQDRTPEVQVRKAYHRLQTLQRLEERRKEREWRDRMM